MNGERWPCGCFVEKADHGVSWFDCSKWPDEVDRLKTTHEAAKEDRSRLVEALQEAIAEIDGSPYATKSWGWGIAYRIDNWRTLVCEFSGT